MKPNTLKMIEKKDGVWVRGGIVELSYQTWVAYPWTNFMRDKYISLSKLPQLSFLLFAAECIPDTESITAVQAGAGRVAVMMARSSRIQDIFWK